jgi:hypothetical protein
MKSISRTNEDMAQQGLDACTARLLYSHMRINLSKGTVDPDDDVDEVNREPTVKLTLSMDRFGIDSSNQILLLNNLPFMNFLTHQFLNNVIIKNFVY